VNLQHEVLFTTPPSMFADLRRAFQEHNHCTCMATAWTEKNWIINNLQTGMSRVRFPMVSLEFLSDIILPVTLWPWGRLSL